MNIDTEGHDGKVMFQNKNRPTKRAPDAGESAPSQAVFYALSFFRSDGVPPPAPARVTQAVRRLVDSEAK